MAQRDRFGKYTKSKTVSLKVEIIEYNGWKRNALVTNGAIEAIVTLDIGPRIIRCGFCGSINMFAETAGQQGGVGEDDFKIRGGHRLWIAPEIKPDTYEPDNSSVDFEVLDGGIRVIQKPGKISKITKEMEIRISESGNNVFVRHIIKNQDSKHRELAPWSISVMRPGGLAIIPLPRKIPHTQRLTHNQEWSIWPYTDLSDGRWIIGKRYIRLKQEPSLGPSKLGIAHREGWVCYLSDGFLFVKKFRMIENSLYPDGGVNFETFANEEFLELETLGPIVKLNPGEQVSHDETWSLYKNIPNCISEEDIDSNILSKISSP